MNVNLLKQVRDMIKRRPGQFQMDYWFDSRNAVGQHPSHCGTAACIGGWAITIANKTTPRKIMEESGYSFEEIKELLGVDMKQSDKLFVVSGWPARFREAYYGAKTAKKAAAAAVGRINHFIKTKGNE